MKFNELYYVSWMQSCWIFSIIFLKNEQVQKGEKILQVIYEKIKIKKLISSMCGFEPIRKKYSTCLKIRLNCAATVLSL